MSYRLVKGEFHLLYHSTRRVGSQPDGDSLWFKPDDVSLFVNQPVGRSVKLNKGGFAQLRFEAIDALELHFRGTAQNHKLAVESRDFALEQADFTSVEYSPKLYLTVRASVPLNTKGYILVRRFRDGSTNVDPYGRPVSFVFSGSTNLPDGTEEFVDVRRMDGSINAALAGSGNAYPAYYTGLPTDLRNRIAALIDSAQSPPKGIWRKDKSTKGFRASDLDDIEPLVIWPKFFRRLVSYFKVPNVGVAGFEAWLRDGHDDGLWIVSKGELGNLHDVLIVDDGRVRMDYGPGDLVIVPG